MNVESAFAFTPASIRSEAKVCRASWSVIGTTAVTLVPCEGAMSDAPYVYPAGQTMLALTRRRSWLAQTEGGGWVRALSQPLCRCLPSFW